MVSNSELEQLIATARENGLIVRTKRDTFDTPITEVQMRAAVPGSIGSSWMRPIQAAERLRAFLAESKTPAKDTILVSGIHLHRSGDYAIVEAEIDGKWVEVIREYIEGNFSHIVEPLGMRRMTE